VARGTFYVHFKDRADYLTALHRQFHHDLRAVIAQSTTGLEPGVERVRRPTVAYLDGCLRAKAVKAMLAQARGLPEITAEVTTQNDRFARDAEADFAAMGSPHPLEAARLFVAMVAETALLELDAGRRLPWLRNALFAYLDHLARTD
jgi:AcrR family transcriptional regulator